MPWIVAPHLTYLDRKLVDVVEGRLRKLILGIPVRHGKSELVSGYTPAFLMGNWPDDSVLWAGHTKELAEEYGGFARDVLEQHGPELFGVTVDRSSRKKTSWRIAGRKGRYTARGVGGAFPGRGGRALIIDDPTKTPAEGMSTERQDALERWYTGIARSRLDSGGAVILVMSRWQPLDLAGRLMRLWDNIGEPYEYVHMPAISIGNTPHRLGIGGNARPCCPNGDVLGRKKGEALWPERYDEAELTRIRAEVQEETWNAQYQNDPLPARGAVFSRAWFRRFELRTVLNAPTLIVHGDPSRGEPDRAVHLKSCRIVQFVDLATAEVRKVAGEGTTDPDYFVITTVAIDRARKDIYVLDVFRDRVPGPDQIPTLVHYARTFRPWRVKIESTGFQLSTVQSAIRAGLPADEIKRHKGANKRDRANYIAERYKNGCVFHPYRAPWLDDLENELVAFPKGHDDQVDTMADAGNYLLDPEMDIDSDTMAAGSA